MDNVDLNIDNYNLKELLNLFKLPEKFGEEELKQAKKQVLKTHPDKSNLPPEYFIFYKNAYQYIVSIYQLQNKSYNKEYQIEDKITVDKPLNAINQYAINQKDFSVWFNKDFEKNRAYDEEQDMGYGEWLKSYDNLNNTTIRNIKEMNEYITNKQKEIRSLIVHKNIEEIDNGGSYYSISRNKPENFNSNIFEKLQYNDLKKAHTESVIPVSNEDYERKKNLNINKLMLERSFDDKVKPHYDYCISRTKDELNIKKLFDFMNEDNVS